MTTDRAAHPAPVPPRLIPMPRPDVPDVGDTQEIPRVPPQAPAAAPRVPVAETVDAPRALGRDDAPDDPPGPTAGAVADMDTDTDTVAERVRPPLVARVPAEPAVPRVYVDGSALTRYLVGAPAREAWLAWVGEHEAELVTSPLGLTELRQVARPRGLQARDTARDVADRVEVARFSDQTLRKASHVSAVLPPFVALHVGAALAHPDVTAVATYDLQLARVAALYGLTVVSPGWPDRWWEHDAPRW